MASQKKNRFLPSISVPDYCFQKARPQREQRRVEKSGEEKSMSPRQRGSASCFPAGGSDLGPKVEW